MGLDGVIDAATLGVAPADDASRTSWLLPGRLRAAGHGSPRPERTIVLRQVCRLGAWLRQGALRA